MREGLVFRVLVWGPGTRFLPAAKDVRKELLVAPDFQHLPAVAWRLGFRV